MRDVLTRALRPAPQRAAAAPLRGGSDEACIAVRVTLKALQPFAWPLVTLLCTRLLCKAVVEALAKAGVEASAVAGDKAVVAAAVAGDKAVQAAAVAGDKLVDAAKVVAQPLDGLVAVLKECSSRTRDATPVTAPCCQPRHGAPLGRGAARAAATAAAAHGGEQPACFKGVAG